MKFENMVVHCENQYEKEKVISVLKNNNCKHWDSFLKDGNYIAVYPETPSFTIYKDNITASDDVFYTYQQFMEKYAMSLLKQKIEQVKQELGYKYLSYLSIDLGYAHNYLGRVLRKGLESKAEEKLIAKLDEFLELHKKELTHDFEGKALNTQVEDAMMISKSEYESLQKEVSHKTQVAEKHADMRAKAEAEAQAAIEKMLLAEKDSEKWQGDYWTVSRENIELINSKRNISIWLAVSILIIVVMLVFGVLHFNGVV